MIRELVLFQIFLLFVVDQQILAYAGPDDSQLMEGSPLVSKRSQSLDMMERYYRKVARQLFSVTQFQNKKQVLAAKLILFGRMIKPTNDKMKQQIDAFIKDSI